MQLAEYRAYEVSQFARCAWTWTST